LERRPCAPLLPMAGSLVTVAPDIAGRGRPGEEVHSTIQGLTTSTDVTAPRWPAVSSVDSRSSDQRSKSKWPP